MRLNIEQQADGSLKGYAFYTGKNADWQRVPVIQFQDRGSQQVAEFGEGLELIWTPAVDPGETLGIPSLEAAPQAPTIWVYPPTEASRDILVNPIYPPEYQDFILVFPPDSAVRPLYVVVSELWKGRRNPDHDYFPAPKTSEITGFPGLIEQKRKTPKQGGSGLPGKDGKTPKAEQFMNGTQKKPNWRLTGIVILATLAPSILTQANAWTGQKINDA